MNKGYKLRAIVVLLALAFIKVAASMMHGYIEDIPHERKTCFIPQRPFTVER